MNNSDRSQLKRVYVILNGIPGPAGLGAGSQSASVSGFASYAHDMEYVKKETAAIIMAMYWPAPDLSAEENKADIEERLQKLEQFIARRRSEGWSLSGAGA